MIHEPTTVMLIDDHPVVRSGFRRLLEKQENIQVVAEASDGETGHILYLKHKPDVLIIDLSMPGIDGIETIRRIKAQDKAARILVFSMHSNKTMLSHSLKAGATGYVSKQCSIKELIEAISQAKNGKSFISPELLSNEANNPTPKNCKDNPLSALTEREYQVFKLFAEGNSCVQIADLIAISPKTVGVHHTSLMKKLNLHNTAQLVRMAIRNNVISST